MEIWKIVGLVSGLFLGGVLILTASWTWFKTQRLGFGGGSLLLGGMLVILTALAALGDWKVLGDHSKAGEWSIELKKIREQLNGIQEGIEELKNAILEVPAVESGEWNRDTKSMEPPENVEEKITGHKESEKAIELRNRIKEALR